jgi:hypothetical protein
MTYAFPRTCAILYMILWRILNAQYRIASEYNSLNKPLKGVVANIAVSHTAAGGSIPPIGVSFLLF